MSCPNCTCSELPPAPESAGPDDVYRWALLGVLNRIAVALESQNTVLAPFAGVFTSAMADDDAPPEQQ